ncbi:MAG TPA: hypothetical protein VFM06_04795 [Candidatus Limnocylindria bacterium]|nr:hypothetical protein [Candidatus Limnocylindria bacterium]
MHRLFGVAVSQRWPLVIIAIALLVGGFVTSIVLADEGGNRAQDATAAAAAAELGRPLPEVRSTFAGLHRSGIGLDPVGAPSRKVHVSYAIGEKNLVLLRVFRGALAAADTQDSIALANGVAASVSTKTLSDGTTDVGYAWSKDGLSYTLHVNLSQGLTRIAADEIARSVK